MNLFSTRLIRLGQDFASNNRSHIMKPSILLFGGSSILGYHIARLFPHTVVPFISPGNRSISIRGWPILRLDAPEWIHTTFSHYQPNVLLYCHAVCDVPKCEAAPDWAYDLNVNQVFRMMQALPSHTRLVYISSDHVFGGDGIYDEHSDPCPISVYGRTRVEAEGLVLSRPLSLVVRVGLAIGASPNGRTGHLDWLRYRTRQNLPITIVEDEFRSTAWAKDLALRVIQLAQSTEEGLRHLPVTHAISRVELANYLLERLGVEAHFKRESRHQRREPHLGRVELASRCSGLLTRPLTNILATKNPSEFVNAFSCFPTGPSEAR